MADKLFKYSKYVYRIPIVVILVLWCVYIVEIKFGFNFNKYGIYPQKISGLKGILFSPFIHSDIKHLFNNSMPILVLLPALYYFYYKIANKIIFYGILLTGFLTWSFGRPAFHIGASGMIYLLVSFIFFSGVFRKYYRLVALSLIVVFLYGSMVWYIFPMEDRISWEGHLSGFLVGLLFAFIFKTRGPTPNKFEYSKNEEFESLFDNDGNFAPPEKIEDLEKGTDD